MAAVLGLSLLCLAALWFAAMLSVYRRPVPPRWTSIDLIAELMTVAILAIGVFGVGMLFEFAATGGLQGLGLVDGALILVVLVATALLGRRLAAPRAPTAMHGA